MGREKGLTLIEIIIAMAIVAIVVAIALTLIQFSSRTYNEGVTRRDLQMSVRNIVDIVTDEVRYISDTMDIVEYEDRDKESYIRIEEEGLVRYVDGEREYHIGMEGVDYKESVFEVKVRGDKKVIKMTIRGKSGEHEYESIKTVSPLSGEVRGTKGDVIKFQN